MLPQLGRNAAQRARRRRAVKQQRSAESPTIFIATVVAGLLLIVFSGLAFNKSKAARAEERQRRHATALDVAARLAAESRSRTQQHLAAAVKFLAIPPPHALRKGQQDEQQQQQQDGHADAAQQRQELMLAVEQAHALVQRATEAVNGADAGVSSTADAAADAAADEQKQQRLAAGVDSQAAGLEVSEGQGALLQQEQHGRGQDAGSVRSQEEQAHWCDQHFGRGWLRQWNATRRELCPPYGAAVSAGAATLSASSSLACRSMMDEHMPAAAAPHVLCDGRHVLLDPGKLRRVRCPRHRPGYLCISRTYHAYNPGAFSLACQWSSAGQLDLEQFSRDHQRDIFESFRGLKPPQWAQAAATADMQQLPTLLVTREIREHANVYHTLTDLLNVHISLSMLGWHARPRQVLILDQHPNGPLDLFWPVVAAGGGSAALRAIEAAEAAGRAGVAAGAGGSSSSSSSSSWHPWEVPVGGRLLVRRVEDLPGPTVLREAAFVPPGYTSLLFAHLYEPNSCPQTTALFTSFRRFMLEPFDLLAPLDWHQHPQQRGHDQEHGVKQQEFKLRASNSRRRGLQRRSSQDSVNSWGSSDAPDGSSSSSSRRAGGTAAAAARPVQVVLVSRRPGAGRRRVARQMANEAEVVAMLEELARQGVPAVQQGQQGQHGSADVQQQQQGQRRHTATHRRLQDWALRQEPPVVQVTVQAVDLAPMSLQHQLTLLAGGGTDVLIGMHGAALAWALLMPPHAAVVELWPQPQGIWRCYEHFSEWAGLLYRKVASHRTTMRHTPTGDASEVDVQQLRTTLMELLPKVQARKAAAAAGSAAVAAEAAAHDQNFEGS